MMAIAFVYHLYRLVQLHQPLYGKVSDRAREVGVRKVVGARRYAVTEAVLLESALVNFAAFTLPLAANSLMPVRATGG